MSEKNQRVTFHIGSMLDEKFFASAQEAKEYILSVMRGDVIYETEEDGEPVFIPLHRITGAILHPQPVGDV